MKKVLLVILSTGGRLYLDVESVNGFCQGGKIIETKKVFFVSDGITRLPTSARVRYPLCKIDGLKYRNITVVIKSLNYDLNSSNVRDVSFDEQNIVIDYDKRIIYVNGDIFVDYSN